MTDFSDSELTEILRSAPVVPLVQSNDPEGAAAISQALLDGGLKVLEVVLRTDEAMQCLAEIVKRFPDVPVGAGTVLTGEQAEKAVEIGAKFIVSPGLTDDVVKVAQKAGIPVLPGVATASEMQKAYGMGLRTMKFFPASLAGGPAMIKALSSVFRDVSIMPTGGVKPGNLSDYLAVSSVVACGGSWLTPADAIKAGDFGAITTLAKDALEIAKSR